MSLATPPHGGSVAAPSIVRTIVPIAVGYLAALLLRWGIGLDESALAGLTEFLGALFSAVYYVLIRAVEQRWPKIGVLLGWASTPDSYSPNPTPRVVRGGPHAAPGEEF